MPIPNFHKNLQQKVIITPKQHLLAEQEDYKNFLVPDAIIFCFEEYLMDHVQANYEVKSAKFWTGDIHYFKDTGNKVGLMGNFGIGGPASCHLLEILIAAGVKKFVVLGHAGGLQKTNPIGSLVLCQKAIRDEGVSYHYLEDSKFSFASPTLTRHLQQSFLADSLNFKLGSTWTIDSMYRETIDEIRHYEQEGIDTVEMEAASLFAVAKFRQVQLTGLFVISDFVTFEEWEDYLYANDTTKALFQALKHTKKALVTEIMEP